MKAFLKINTVLFVLLFIGNHTYAQGILKGVVSDSTSEESIPFAQVKVADKDLGAQTDFDGAYSLKLPAGNYKIEVRASEYKEKTYNVTIVNGQSTELNIRLSMSAELEAVLLSDAVVTAYKKNPNTVQGFDNNRRKAINTSDGISREQMRSNGDSDAGETMQRVTGVTVQNGQNIYVRGLGDRYTLTLLNGMSIPGLDPESNSVQMDVFPTNLIDNLIVYKTFTPDLQGDFTGGLVDITTKDFPTKKTVYFQASLGGTNTTTFHKNYFTYKGGKFDFLGVDDGSRKLPIGEYAKFPDPSKKDPTLTTMMQAFDPEMAISNGTAFLNQSYTYSIGNKIRKEKYDYGYNVSLNYRNNYNYYDSIQFNQYRKDSDSKNTELTAYNSNKGQLSENNVLWTVLIGQSFNFNNKHKYSLTLFQTQSSTKTTSDLTFHDYELNPAILRNESLQFRQRSISTAQLKGQHDLDKWKMIWNTAATISRIKDPDIRSTILEEETDPDGTVHYRLNGAVGGQVRRIFRDLKEYNLSARYDISREYKIKDSLKTTVKFGALNNFKHRDYTINDYNFDVKGTPSYDDTQFDPNVFFQPENIWTLATNTGTYGKGEKQLANTYTATQNVLALYAMNEYPLTPKFNVTYGARMEKAVNTYTGQNNSGTIVYNKEKVLDNLNVLPSLNMVYKINNKKPGNYTNYRAAYTQTVARPSFREKSVAQIFDPIQGRRFNGNIDLKQTLIHNADLRWEYFFGKTELISASAFYKYFINPIEIASFDVAPTETKPVNAGTAEVYGAEVELRKAIYLEKDSDENAFTLGFNYSYVVSRIDMTKIEITKGSITSTELELRQQNARDGEEVSRYRPMYGQSPYVINTFLNYANKSLKLNVNVSYNVQGQRLSIIGVGKLPDVYEMPFNSLNCKVSKEIGQKELWQLSITAKNLLNNARRRYYISYDAKPQIYDYIYQGISVQAAITYNIK